MSTDRRRALAQFLAPRHRRCIVGLIFSGLRTSAFEASIFYEDAIIMF